MGISSSSEIHHIYFLIEMAMYHIHVYFVLGKGVLAPTPNNETVYEKE